jgi:hypothetical protein
MIRKTFAVVKYNIYGSEKFDNKFRRVDPGSIPDQIMWDL